MCSFNRLFIRQIKPEFIRSITSASQTSYDRRPPVAASSTPTAWSTWCSTRTSSRTSSRPDSARKGGLLRVLLAIEFLHKYRRIMIENVVAFLLYVFELFRPFVSVCVRPCKRLVITAFLALEVGSITLKNATVLLHRPFVRACVRTTI